MRKHTLEISPFCQRSEQLGQNRQNRLALIFSGDVLAQAQHEDGESLTGEAFTNNGTPASEKCRQMRSAFEGPSKKMQLSIISAIGLSCCIQIMSIEAEKYLQHPLCMNTS